jgi:hypothetical protein
LRIASGKRTPRYAQSGRMRYAGFRGLLSLVGDAGAAETISMGHSKENPTKANRANELCEQRAGDDDSRSWLAARLTRLIDFYDMKIAAGIACRVLVSVRRANPDLDGKVVSAQGGYHVSFRHSFNGLHYRRGT